VGLSDSRMPADTVTDSRECPASGRWRAAIPVNGAPEMRYASTASILVFSGDRMSARMLKATLPGGASSS
jgi:hypothetical protein